MARNTNRNTHTKGKSAVMGVNKSRTPLWMKIVLVAIALAMSLGMALSFATMTAPQQQQQQSRGVTGPAAKSVEGAEKKYAKAIAEYEAKVEADPTDRPSVVELGNLYFDMALEANNVAKNFDELLVVQAWWAKSAEVYEDAVKIQYESPVEVDAAIAMYYSGDTTAALEAVTQVTDRDPGFAMAWMNLGQFREGAGDVAGAIEAYEKYLEVDATNTTGYRRSVEDRLKEIR